MRSVILFAAALGLAACQTAAERASADAETDALIAARQGAEVDRICFTGNINSWSPLGRDAILLRQSVNDWYKVDLTGACEPQWAFNSIAIASRPLGSSCLHTGDRIATDDRNNPNICYIDRIYEWDETKEPAAASSPAPSPTAG